MADRDNIIRMAGEAGFKFQENSLVNVDALLGIDSTDTLQRFAELVIADFLQCTGQYITNDASREAAIADAVAEEREGCAKLCEARQTPGTGSVAILTGAADAIRARGQHD